MIYKELLIIMEINIMDIIQLNVKMKIMNGLNMMMNRFEKYLAFRPLMMKLISYFIKKEKINFNKINFIIFVNF